MPRPITYPKPLAPPGFYKTYSIFAPLKTHFKSVSCMEFGCLAMRNGWRTTVDERKQRGKKQAYYIRYLSRRKYTEMKLPDGRTEFTFEAGQQCFQAPHRQRIDRPELFVVREGDFRRYGTTRYFDRSDQFVDDFSNHQSRLALLMRRG